MKILFFTLLFVSAIATQAQTVANTSNVLHPIMKDPSKRQGISSVDRDPEAAAEYRRTPQAAAARPATTASAATTSEPTKAAEIVARIDSSLAASGIHLIGTITGLKGRLTVTNLGAQIVIPHATIAVCDRQGIKIGSTSKMGSALGPNESETIDIVATNANAVDLKLMKLSGNADKK